MSTVRLLTSCLTLVLVGSIFSGPATAHPGHGEPGAMHYLTQPQHLIELAIVAAALMLLLLLFRRHKLSRI